MNPSQFLPDWLMSLALTLLLLAITFGARRKRDWTFGAVVVPFIWYWAYYTSRALGLTALGHEPETQLLIVRGGMLGLCLSLGMYALNGRVQNAIRWAHLHFDLACARVNLFRQLVLARVCARIGKPGG